MTEVIILAHNIRSTHNVGAIFRTAEGFGISQIICSGYTPYPTTEADPRLPHISEKLTKQIHKTALGAETMVPFSYRQQPPLAELSAQGYTIVGLEQAPNATLLPHFTPSGKIALLIGEEVHGIEQSLINECDTLIEIPMRGQKESFNVSVATGIALYQITCQNT